MILRGTVQISPSAMWQSGHHIQRLSTARHACNNLYCVWCKASGKAMTISGYSRRRAMLGARLVPHLPPITFIVRSHGWCRSPQMACPAPGHGLGFNELKVIEVAEILHAIAGLPSGRIDFGRGLRIEQVIHAFAQSSAVRAWVDIE